MHGELWEILGEKPFTCHIALLILRFYLCSFCVNHIVGFWSFFPFCYLKVWTPFFLQSTLIIRI